MKLPCAPVPADSATVGGVKRKAAFGTNRTFSRFAVTIHEVAVMRGRKARSSLATARTVLYVTTLSVVVDPMPTRRMVAGKLRPDHADTVKVAGWPSFTLPASSSQRRPFTPVRPCALARRR